MRADFGWNAPSGLLVTISTLMLQLALYERQGGRVGDWVHLGIGFFLALVVHASRRKRLQRIGSFLTTTSFTALIVLPFAWDAVERLTANGEHPFEIQVALTLRNMMLGLAAKREDHQSQKFAALASCFLALFSILWSMNRWTIALLFSHTIVGMWWLMGVYWERLSGCFLSHTERNVPWKPLGAAAGMCVVGLLVLLPLATSGHFTSAVDGFLPSSGGTRWQDESAYGGVGDGPQMVSAKENASGFGPIESELFLESEMPTLYDCFNEFSDELPKSPKIRAERAIPLDTSMMQQNHQKRGTNQQASREFNTVRTRKQETQKVSDIRSHALLQVAGRVPIHLGLHAYDLWDGQILAASNNTTERRLYLDTTSEDGRAWARYTDAAEDEVFTYRDRHEIRILNLKTNRVPSPPNNIGVHVDKLHTETLFDVAQDGMLALNLESIPQLTVMHVESLQRTSGSRPPVVRASATPIGSSDRICSLAREWTLGIDDDWQKIEAVCERLRQEYVLDTEQMAPADADDAAAHFLFRSKRGPDYLFATSAALLIRSLGFEVRVVSGFYADARHFDPQSRLTSVFADDAHFWVEVLTASSGDRSAESAHPIRWVAIDPSPGYEILFAPESLWAQLLTRVALTWNALKHHPLIMLVSLAVCIAAWTKRTAVCDSLITGWWYIDHRWGDVRYQVISTLRLLNRRARLRGVSPSKGTPLGRWDLTARTGEADTERWEAAFRDLANWALYGDGIPLEHAPREVQSLCRQAAAVAYRLPGRPQSCHRSQVDWGTA